MTGTQRPTLVICGNGASAVALLHAIASRFPASLDIFIIGKGEPGEGLAYATRNPSHLLNAPAGGMSIDPGQPNDFVEWLQARNLWSGGWPGQFVSRSHYGHYLREAARKAAAHPHLAVTFLREDVISLTRNRGGWRVAHDKGQINADFVVLATGNDMPSPMAPRLDAALGPLIADNPWKLPSIAPHKRVLILGTGLTAVDTVLSLHDGGHTGEIRLVSRHGMLPKGHVPQKTHAGLAVPFANTARALLCALREAAGSANGQNWQDLMDAMRPHWPTLWHQMPLREKRRFLRHGATIWNLHRHRLPPQATLRLQRRLDDGAVRMLKGRLVSAQPADSGAVVTIRSAARETTLAVDRIINCMGPNMDPAKTYNPLIENIVASLQARTCASGIGLDVTDDNRVIGHDGMAHASMFAMGSLTRGLWWEITAMPEIVRQASQIAESLSGVRYREVAQAVRESAE
ncbi:MAG: Hydroxyacylglutathione hydrolase [Alphaproteobacteria bacterium]|nr:Hydroxyacylglutathione hydrolase [Alphaproteobacteria bacterium]